MVYEKTIPYFEVEKCFLCGGAPCANARGFAAADIVVAGADVESILAKTENEMNWEAL